ncbi:hypothetical protein [Bacillus inaquosorum]|uniref:hypothetical protein n=1 Tax=Bacillus inaquosorum TaxID=483913 RepID=UPI0022832071|nr:hypothetical protein [Bacillus inaquosorum]MCY8056489.1 hypothetical protein [Bacillus inaquosorum]MCY9397642.1 hypothetical protein [Bacillus inaquosorum]
MQLFILKDGGYEDMNELMFNIFAVLAFIFCLLGYLAKKPKLVLVLTVIGAIFLITATCTGGFIDALHSWLSIFRTGDKDELNRINNAGIHVIIIFIFLLFVIILKCYLRRNNSKED